MFDFSLSELLVVLLVFLVVGKTEDFPKILSTAVSFLRRIRLFIYETNKKVSSYIDSISSLEENKALTKTQTLDSIENDKKDSRG